MDDDWTPEPGDAVEIIEGPFAEYAGIVESLDEEKDKVRVRISFFGRETPVELPRTWLRKSQNVY